MLTRRRALFGFGVAVLAIVVVLGVAWVRDRRASAPTAAAAGAVGGFTGGDFHSLVADPSVAGRVFVGGHEAVSVSSDGGASWTEVGGLANVDAMGWAFNGAGGVWIGGHPGIVSSSGNLEVVRARNGGLPDTDVHALGGSGKMLYAAGPGIGFQRSTDDGATWIAVSTTIGQSFFGRIAVDPKEPNHIVAADPGNGVFASVDGGVTWKQLTATPASWISSPDGLETLYASGVQQATHSTDGGSTWSPLPLPDTATIVEADPTTPRHLYAGAHDGERVRVWSSVDDGATWQNR